MSDRKYLVDPKTKRKYPIGGCLISGKPSDGPKFGAIRVLGAKDLPPGVDLRALMTPIEQQLDTYACTGNALAGAYEFLIMKNSKKHVDVSRLFIYYNSRLIDGLKDYNMQDRGSYISSGIKALALYGCCKEDIFPYRTDLINRRPPKECYDQAKNYRIAQSMSVEVTLDEMKACLAQGYPFAFGLELCQSFMDAGSNYGRVRTPSPYEQQAAQHGWHAMLAVGYSDPSGCFIVRNSWGADWGEDGYCYIPYEYMANPKRCQDLHSIRAVTGESHSEPDRKINNPFDWNSEKKNVDNVPPDYPYPDFHYKYFWQYHNVFNYFNALFHNGHVIPFVWGMMGEGEQPNSSSKLVVYIDQKHEGMIWVKKEILSYDKSIRFESCETMKKAEDFLSKNKNSFRSLSHFQIITRGFYKDENKNALNLLDFLITNRITNAQVFVYTQHIQGVEQYFENQAASFHLPDWRRKLIIVDDAEELVENMKKLFEKK